MAAWRTKPPRPCAPSTNRWSLWFAAARIPTRYGTFEAIVYVDPEDDIDFDLIQPVIPVWRIAQMGVGYDDDEDRIIIVVQELVEPGETAEVGRFTIEREHARAFARHALEVIAAGRPTCPLCGQALDPAGHFCPKSNGHGKQYLQ